VRAHAARIFTGSLACSVLAGCAVVFSIALWLRLDTVIGRVYWDGDAATALVLGQTFNPSRGFVVLLHIGIYTTLFWEYATRWLPWHRHLWEATPYAFSLLSAGFLGWTSRRLAGTWAAVVSVALAVCTNSRLTFMLFTPNYHTTTAFTTVLIGAYIVFVSESTGRGRLLAASLVVGVVAGANAASDPLLYYTGLGGLALTAVVVACGRRSVTDRLTVGIGVVLSIATASAVLTTDLGRHWGIRVYQDPYGLAKLSDYWPATVRFVEDTSALLNGSFRLHGAASARLLAIACLVLVCATVVLAVTALVRRFRGRASVIRAETVYLTYWLGVVLLVFASYVGSTEGARPGYQYFIVTVYAFAALAPLVLPRTRAALWITTAAILLYCTASFVSTQFQWTNGRTAVDAELPTIERIAAANHATVGYADFWSASPATWHNDFKFPIIPIDTCIAANTYLCDHFVQMDTSWYQPRTGTSTVLITAPGGGYFNGNPGPSLGQSTKEVPLPGGITVYVYPYDIASRLHRWRVVR
jgi:hypothetical protein